MKDQDLKQFLAKHQAGQWVKDNPDMMKDVYELCNKAMMFQLKWGFPLRIVVDKKKKK